MADVDEGTPNSDYIVMTPTKKGGATHINIERKRRLAFDESDVAHVAGGQHKGLVINKQAADDENDLGKPQLQLAFTCFLIDQKTGDHIVETRKLKFWYVEGTEYLDQVTRAYDFFKELIKPDDLPRDYVGFIKKCMKQMQGTQYKQIKKVDLSMQQLNKDDAPLSPEFITPITEDKLEASINLGELEQRVERDIILEREEEVAPAVTVVKEKNISVVQTEQEQVAPAVIIEKEQTIKAFDDNYDSYDYQDDEEYSPVPPSSYWRVEDLPPPIETVVNEEEMVAPVVIIDKDKNVTTLDNYVEEDRIASVQMEREERIAPVVMAREESVKTVDTVVEEERISSVQMEREEMIAPVVMAKEESVKTVETVEREEQISPVVIVAKEESIKTIVDNVEREERIAPVVMVKEESVKTVDTVVEEERIGTVQMEKEQNIASVVEEKKQVEVTPVVIAKQETVIASSGTEQEAVTAPVVIVEEKKVVEVTPVIAKQETVIAPAATVVVEDKREEMIAPVVVRAREENVAPVFVMEKEKEVTPTTHMADHTEKTIAPGVIHEKEKTIDRYEEREEEFVEPGYIRVDEETVVQHFAAREEQIKTVKIVEEDRLSSSYKEREETISPVVVEKEMTVKRLYEYEEDALSPADDFEELPLPPIDDFGLTADGLPKVDNRPPEEIVNEKLLHILESAYPNVLAVEDLIRITAADEVMIREQLKELHARNLVAEMEQGGFMRRVLDEKSEVQLVKQMPTIATNQQPTIAIITAMFYEKLAVDAMMENKTTYMKYKTEGESNVYTIGFIGEHKVVSTKLPAIGHAMFAQISSGNTTTRLLGSFQNIEHVFVVGVAGGVPYYTDYYKHVRLGDIVISKGGRHDNIYYYCQKILKNKEGDLQYVHKTFAPKDKTLQQLAQQIAETAELSPDNVPWEQYIAEGQQLLLGQEADFVRPMANTDRLYMNIGEDNIIEVEHPQPPQSEGEVKAHVEKPRIHFGVLGSGRPVVKTDATRLDFASKYNIKAFDTEFDQVLESIEGNRKDSYMFIRGISDYTDGSKNKEWQPYAALVAAAYMKTIIKAMQNPTLDDMDN